MTAEYLRSNPQSRIVVSNQIKWWGFAVDIFPRTSAVRDQYYMTDAEFDIMVYFEAL